MSQVQDGAVVHLLEGTHGRQRGSATDVVTACRRMGDHAFKDGLVVAALLVRPSNVRGW